MTAQITACESGEKRVLALINKYGKESLNSAIEDVLNNDEMIMRKAISGIPEGRYSTEAWIDDNGFDDNPLKVCLTLEVKGDEITFDFTGSSPQTEGFVNAPYAATGSAVLLTFLMLINPDIPHNDGISRPIHIVNPEGSFLNARFPAAFSGSGPAGWSIRQKIGGRDQTSDREA